MKFKNQTASVHQFTNKKWIILKLTLIFEMIKFDTIFNIYSFIDFPDSSQHRKGINLLLSIRKTNHYVGGFNFKLYL